jgi:glycosyltransferase involved in cell wall biosynthesis
MAEKKRILVICSSSFVSGAEHSLSDLIHGRMQSHEFIVALPDSFDECFKINGQAVYYLPFKWFYNTWNPLRLFQFAMSMIKCSFQLARIIKEHQIDLIYANTTKANLYAITAKLYTKKKIVWQIRDNIKHNALNKILMKKSDMIIPVSLFIGLQVSCDESKKRLVYGGMDVKKWGPKTTRNKTLKKELQLPNDTMLIAQVGQLTRWKNQTDFIRAAGLIRASRQKVHFLIIGDDLSKREEKYKQELIERVDQLGMTPHLTFLGQRKDIQEVLDQIDILIHPAIDEPFGRVLIEAMAMEKPVVAYNCGGPREIIVNNETGYLVEPYDYRALANKTMALIQDQELRDRFGKAGRERVIEKFNMERYVKEMEEVFGIEKQTQVSSIKTQD